MRISCSLLDFPQFLQQRWLILRSVILLVSAAAIADPEIDSLSFCRNEIDSLEFLQQSVDHESNFLFSFCTSQ